MADQYNKILTTVNSVTSNYSFTPDLSNVIVIDTSNNRIGINTVNPQYSIDICNGKIKTNSLIVDISNTNNAGPNLSDDYSIGHLFFDNSFIYLKTHLGWKKTQLLSI